jgi:hypothetical protein
LPMQARRPLTFQEMSFMQPVSTAKAARDRRCYNVRIP